MPTMVSPTGEIKELGYGPGSDKEARMLEEQGWTRKKDKKTKGLPGAMPSYTTTKPTRTYQLGGLVHRSGPKRKRVKARGTGAATRGLDFYKG